MKKKKKNNKKIFILDTNVLLHDYNCIYNFEENDVIIPIVVLEELDKFKKGNDMINFHAREFTRELDKLSGDMLLTTNIALGKNRGNLYIETGRNFSEKVSQSFPEMTADHRILAIADHVCANNTDKTVVLITKDINLRMKAKSLGIMAQDYENDKVANIDDIYNDIQILEDIDPQLINKLYEIPEGIESSEFNLSDTLKGHRYYIMKNAGSSALAHYDPVSKIVSRVISRTTYGIASPKC